MKLSARVRVRNIWITLHDLGQMEREERDLLKQRAGEVESAQGAKSTIIYGTTFCLVFVMAQVFHYRLSAVRLSGRPARGRAPRPSSSRRQINKHPARKSLRRP